MALSARTAGLRRKVFGVANALLDLVYPPVCAGCRGRHASGATPTLCEACRGRLAFIEESCPRCGQALGPFASGRKACPTEHRGLVFREAAAVCRYEGVAADLVRAFKFGRDMRALEAMAPLLIQRLEETAFTPKIDVVVPVPLHWLRRAWRRFNQAELIGERIADALSLAFEPDALKRSRYTIPQYQLASRERGKNLAGAFKVRDPGEVRDAAVLLVDDVMTTCSTARECARALRAAGARATYVAVFAR